MFTHVQVGPELLRTNTDGVDRRAHVADLVQRVEHRDRAAAENGSTSLVVLPALRMPLTHAAAPRSRRC